jgi:hypothetical protein
MARALTPLPIVATLRAGYRPLAGILPAGGTAPLPEPVAQATPS